MRGLQQFPGSSCAFGSSTLPKDFADGGCWSIVLLILRNPYISAADRRMDILSLPDEVRVPRHDGHDSGLMADSIPE